MGKKFVLTFLASLWVIFLAGVAMGQHGHDHGSPSSAPQKGTSQEMTVVNQPQSVTLEGFKITFEVMDMSMHMSMPGMKGSPQHGASEHSQSHALMVKVQDTASKEIISDAKVQYTLIRPSGRKRRVNWYGQGTITGEGSAQRKRAFTSSKW